jgi:hypothetical protein
VVMISWAGSLFSEQYSVGFNCGMDSGRWIHDGKRGFTQGINARHMTSSASSA